MLSSSTAAETDINAASRAASTPGHPLLTRGLKIQPYPCPKLARGSIIHLTDLESIRQIGLPCRTEHHLRYLSVIWSKL